MSNYVYYNRNPYQLNINDCVCRAISTVLNVPYFVADKLLIETAQNNNCPKLCVCCYDNLLSKRLGYRKIKCKNGETVRDVAYRYPNCKLIIRINKHLTTSLYGILADTWDCGNKIVDCFWIKE